MPHAKAAGSGCSSSSRRVPGDTAAGTPGCSSRPDRHLTQHSWLTPSQRRDSALALAFVGLVFLPLLQIVRHAELILRGLTAALAYGTGALACLYERLRRAAAARSLRPGGGQPDLLSAGYILPLPLELSLLPAASVATLLPLAAALGYGAVAAAVPLLSAVPTAAAPAAASAAALAGQALGAAGAAAAAAATSVSLSVPSCWVRAGALYALALVLPSPAASDLAPRVATHTAATAPYGWAVGRGAAAATSLRQLLLQAARLLVLAVAMSWATAGSATATATPAVPGPAAAPGLAGSLWAVWVGCLWALHTIGLLATWSGN